MKTDAREVMLHNAGVLAERGPGLSSAYQIAYTARCPSGKHGYAYGLGGMGMGEMWCGLSGNATEPGWLEAFQALPVRECSGHCLCPGEPTDARRSSCGCPGLEATDSCQRGLDQ